MTALNAVLMLSVNSCCFATFLSEVLALSSAGNSTMRGSGLHHSTGSPSLNHGKIPCRYALSRCALLRVPPIAIKPLGSVKACSSGGSRHAAGRVRFVLSIQRRGALALCRQGGKRAGPPALTSARLFGDQFRVAYAICDQLCLSKNLLRTIILPQLRQCPPLIAKQARARRRFCAFRQSV